jgi:hypothetical protein
LTFLSRNAIIVSSKERGIQQMIIEQIMETYSKGYDVMIDDGFNTWTPSGNDEWDALDELGWTCTNKEVNEAGIKDIEVLPEKIVIVKVGKEL